MPTQKELYDAFVDCLYDILANGGVKVTCEDGSISRLPLGASELGVIRQFLKDYPVERSTSAEEFVNNYGDLPFFQATRTPEKRDKRNVASRSQ